MMLGKLNLSVKELVVKLLNFYTPRTYYIRVHIDLLKFLPNAQGLITCINIHK